MHCVKRKDKGVNAGPGGREKGRVNQMSNDPAIRKQLSSLEGTVLLFSKTSRAITGLGVSQPTVSKHLKTLEGAGLVDSRKDGLWVDYSLSDGSESPYAGVLLGNLRHWLENDEAVSRIVRKLPSIRREDICKK